MALVEEDSRANSGASARPVASERFVGARRQHSTVGPFFEGRDIVAMLFAAIMTLGPLAAYATGWGN